jgi:replicative DNA helicase
VSAEECLLGACLSAAYALPAALEEGVTSEDFGSDLHQAVWKAMQTVAARLSAGEHLDPMLVSSELNGSPVPARDAAAYLHALITTCPIASNARQYAREVMDNSLKRKVRRMLMELQDAELGGNELLERLQEGAFSLERRPREAKTMSAAFKEVWYEAEHPTKATCSYPWREVDYWTRGMRPGWLTYLAGESSQGKTAAALEIADHALGEGKNVLFLSLEMTAFELAVRLAQRNGFRAETLYGKNPHQEDFTALSKLIGQDKWQRLRIETVDNVGQIGAIIRRAKPDLVILDYIQLLDIGKDTRLEGTTKNSRALKMLARKHSIPIVALSQLSRAGKEDRGKTPGLWRLRDSGALEQDADAVVFVWRKRGEDGEGMLPEGAFIVAKARMGRQGKLEFTFDGERQTFTPLTDRRPT